MSQVEAENISGGRTRDASELDDAVYQAAKKLVNSVESGVTVDSSLKRKAGTQVLADATKVDKCPAPLVGCSAAELFKATGGELTCPDLSMAPEPLVVDAKGRICYAKEDITNHWMETGPDGKKRYKKITVENLINKYSQELLEKFLDPSNKKLLIAASQAARNGFNIPPIILNFYKYNPFVSSFIKNSSKGETRIGVRLGDSKKFRGLKQFTVDNGYAEYQTQEIFATILSNFTNNLDLNTGAEFLTTMMTPVIRTPETIRGIFDIYCPGDPSVKLDFLYIEPYQRSDPTPRGVIHAVNANICELMFSAIAATSRDSRRVEKLTKLINSLGEMLKFGELAPEYENPENKCRQAGVAASNAINFLPNTLKKWLCNLPSTWRRSGPTALLPNQPMVQREEGRKPTVHGEGCGEGGAGGGSGGGSSGDSGDSPHAFISGKPKSSGLLGPAFFPKSPSAEEEEEMPDLQDDPSGDAGKMAPKGPRDAGRMAAPGLFDQIGSYLPSFSAGGQVIYTPPSEVAVRGGRRGPVANPASVRIDGSEDGVLDPRMILQNFVSLCFYLNWVESFASNSDDSILSMFKSLRVSHEAAMAARNNVEGLLKLKAEESTLRVSTGTNFKSAVTDKMAEEALAAKKGADASYMGTNVRIAKRLAKLLDIGWEKCKSNQDLQSASTDLNQNGWHDKMLPHQNLVKNNPDGDLNIANLRFTVNQMPGLGHNELTAALADNVVNPTDYPDYPNALNDTWASSTIYQNMQDSLLLTGVNTREFRKAWKNTSLAFDGIKSKKNHVARVGFMQFMSRIMDLHLTFAQSCSAGRAYFLKMHEYSLMQPNRAGIPEDPRISALNFDDPGHEMSNYMQVSHATKNLLLPLKDINVCKVVVGESQYFVYKSGSPVREDERLALAQLSKDRLHLMYKSYRNTANNPTWWDDILNFANNSPLPGGRFNRLTDQEKVALASYIIEHSVNFVATSSGPLGRQVSQDKMFGACEPLDTSDYYMLNRRKKFLEMDRPEDELFLLGIEGIAKYLNQTILWNDARAPDPQFARRRAAGGVGAQSERLKVRDTPQDTLRRKGSIEGLNADERDWYARYIIFMTKVSGGSPARLAQYLLEIVNGDSTIHFPGGLANPGGYTDPAGFAAKPAVVGAVPPSPRTLREGVAMSLLYLVRNPVPLFASMGPLHGGEEVVTELSGGSVDGTTPDLPSVEAVDSMINSEIDTLLSGGIEGGVINEKNPQFQPPLHIREAMEAAKKGLTHEEEDLERRLRKLGRKGIVRYDVGQKCPVSLTKYNNLFGKSGNSAWVETNSPWVECQRKMGFQFQTNSGYCYPADDKCYPASDIKHSVHNTAHLVSNWQQLAKVMNALKQSDREDALQEARRLILSEPANQNIGHSELEEMAHKMLPSHLRMLPDKVAMESVVAVSEDIEGQVRELSDDSDEEQKARLRKLLYEHKLLYEQWQDPNKEQQAEYLNELTKDLVENSKLCATVSLAISAQSSSAQLKQNMRGAINYANTMMTPNPSLPNEFVQSLPEDTQVLIRSSTLASKCEVRPLYERDGVILPTKINAMLPDEGDGSEIKHNGLINWWKQYHASTLEKKTKRSDKLSQSIDPSLVDDSKISSRNSEETLQKQLEKALDSKGLALLEHAETSSSSSRSMSRGRRSRSRSRSRG